jgi:ribosomal protein S18 acetylase RimI-like enzyme
MSSATLQTQATSEIDAVLERRHLARPDTPTRTETLRIGALADLRALHVLENRAFSDNRLCRRSFARFLTSPNASLIVAAQAKTLCGYALVLFRSGSEIARLYSLAVDPSYRRQGLGSTLLTAAEQAAYSRGARAMRLELREDNGSAANLYRWSGYRKIKRISRYYEDGAGALRLEKSLGLAGACVRAAARRSATSMPPTLPALDNCDNR